MNNKFTWKIQTGRRQVALLRCDQDGDVVQEMPVDPLCAQQLQADLNELEHYREERRWRKIGEEWPKVGQVCQIANKNDVNNSTLMFCMSNDGRHYWRDSTGGWHHVTTGRYRTFTHWRPAPTDTPKEEA